MSTCTTLWSRCGRLQGHVGGLVLHHTEAGGPWSPSVPPNRDLEPHAAVQGSELSFVIKPVETLVLRVGVIRSLGESDADCLL